MTKHIGLKGGEVALVDEDMHDFLNQWRWRRDSNGYARMDVGYKGIHKAVFMHHFVLGVDFEPGTETDHINCVRLDNRRANLRICTKKQNAQNQSGWKGKRSSRFKGVFPRPGKRRWRAIITCDRRRYQIGEFGSEGEAALAYNKAARNLFGEFARLNDLCLPMHAGQHQAHRSETNENGCQAAARN